MSIGIGNPIYDLANLPGQGGKGGGSAFEYTAIDNSFSMLFDQASNSYFEVTNEIFGGATAFTISVWCNSISYSNDRPILAKWFGESPGLFLLYHDAPNGWRVLFDTSAGQRSFQSTITGSTNVWQHLVCRWDGSEIKFFLNNTTTDTGSAVGGNMTNTNSLYIGADVPLASRDWHGNLDELAIWTTALSDETIQAIYDTTANNPGKVADLSETPEGVPTAWYRMGD